MIAGIDPSDTSRPPIARLQSGGVPIRVGQNNKVWRGQVQAAGSTEPCLPVALKYLPTYPKLVIELACALAAAELDLSVPRGVIVIASSDQLPGLPGFARPIVGHQDSFLCFGSLLLYPDDTAAMILDDAAAQEYWWNRLCETQVAPSGAAWDELAANPDRHIGNVVYDGRRHWLIDHDLALAPIAKVMKAWAKQQAQLPGSIVDHRADTNEIVKQLVRRRPRGHGIDHQATMLAKASARLKALGVRMAGWHTGNSEIDAIWRSSEVVLSGIAVRLPALSLMLSERLGIPPGQSLWNEPKA